MVERFVSIDGTIAIANGSSTVTGIGTLFGGVDRAGAQVWACPDDAAPFKIGTVAEVDPQGFYDNLELPLVHVFNGADYAGAYELIDGAALARGSSQAAIYSRFTAFLQQNGGLNFNLADTVDRSLAPNNSLFWDPVTQVFYEWRNGVLEQLSLVGLNVDPQGDFALGTTYAKRALVQSGGYLFVSNVDGNLGHAPNTAPASTAYWTWMPLPAGSDAFALSIAIGRRPAAGELIPAHAFVDTVTFPAGLTGSHAKARVAFTAESVFALWRNGSSAATVTFAAGATVGVFAAAAPITFTPGDWADLKCPTARDATGEDIRISFKGSR